MDDKRISGLEERSRSYLMLTRRRFRPIFDVQPPKFDAQVRTGSYSSSKVALNAVTVSFAKGFEAFGMKVNAVEPGHVRTDLNGNSAFITPEEWAVIAIKLALIEQDGPTGGFSGSHGRQPW